MNKTFLVVDTSHLLHRTFHVTGGDIWTRAGLTVHIMLESLKKCWRQFDADHIVFALEGRSWRRSIYEPYKKNRDVLYQNKTQKEVEESEILFEAINNFIKFLEDRSNCTVLQNSICEADDMIARWCQTHPNDKHIIVSGDTDFFQLLNDNITIYDGIKDIVIRRDGVINDKGNRVHFTVKSDSKLKILKEVKDDEEYNVDTNWPDWSLFIKLVRGDSGDNVFSAYPGVRLTKIQQAFEDRVDKGFVWNNFMLTSWPDHLGKDHRVRDGFERNKILIDLTLQPDEVKDTMDETIAIAMEPKTNKQIGLYFLKFAGTYDLQRVAAHPEDYTAFLSPAYPLEK